MFFALYEKRKTKNEERFLRAVRDRVGDARGGKAFEAQPARRAPAAGQDVVLVARPGEFQGGPQVQTKAHDPGLVQLD